MKGDRWLVLKVPQDNRSHVMCDFCDGDELDDMQWLEGPFNQDLTVREMIEYQRGSNRARRRACVDNLLRKAHRRGPREVVVIGSDREGLGSSSKGKHESSAIMVAEQIDDGRMSAPETRSGNLSDDVVNFRRRVAPYKGVDLLDRKEADKGYI